jgi:hypothetical protein
VRRRDRHAGQHALRMVRHRPGDRTAELLRPRRLRPAGMDRSSASAPRSPHHDANHRNGPSPPTPFFSTPGRPHGSPRQRHPGSKSAHCASLVRDGGPPRLEEESAAGRRTGKRRGRVRQAPMPCGHPASSPSVPPESSGRTRWCRLWIQRDPTRRRVAAAEDIAAPTRLRDNASVAGIAALTLCTPRKKRQYRPTRNTSPALCQKPGVSRTRNAAGENGARRLPGSIPPCRGRRVPAHRPVPDAAAVARGGWHHPR